MALARAKVMNDEKDIDLETLLKYEAQNKMKLYDGMMARFISEILLHIDDQQMPQVEHWAEKAIDADKRNGTIWNLGKDYVHYAELFRRKGNQSKATEYLDKAIEIFKECGAEGWIKKYEQEFAEL